MVQNIAQRLVFSSDLHDLGGARVTEVVDIPAERTTTAGAYRHLMQMSATRRLAESLHQPRQRRNVVTRFQCAIARKCREVGQHRHDIEIIRKWIRSARGHSTPSKNAERGVDRVTRRVERYGGRQWKSS